MSEIEKNLKRELDAKVPDLKDKIKAEVYPHEIAGKARRKNAAFSLAA